MATRARPPAPAPPLPDESGRSSLGVVVERLRPAVLEVLVAPRGLEASVSQPVILDLDESPQPEADSLVLAVGVEGPTARAGVLDRLRDSGAAAVAFREFGPADPELMAGAEAAGVAVLSVRRGVSWGQLFSLLMTAATVGPPSDGGLQGVPLGDLFSLANGIAAAVGGATTIEDPQSRVLAYSSLEHPIDVPRQETILGRQVPGEWMERLRSSGVFRRLWQTDEVVPIPDFTDHEGYLPRIAVAVRAGGELLGSIWVIQGDRPLGPEAEDTLRQAAQIAALHLLAQRSAHDVDRRRRADALLGVLEGRESGERAGAVLGLETGSRLAVVAFDVAESDEAAATVRAHRVADLIALYSESYRRRAACAVSRGRVYALVPLAPADEADAVLNLAEAIVSRASEALRIDLQAGVGSIVATLAGLAGARAEADDVLDVLEAGPGVATIAQVRSRVVLLRLGQLVKDHTELMDGRIAELAAQDAARGTANLATLAAYFDAFGDIGVAAARVNVHPNTFRYRLRRITETFGLDLGDPEERLVTQLQLRFFGTPPSS